MSLGDARRKCEAWRQQDYNEERPHSATADKSGSSASNGQRHTAVPSGWKKAGNSDPRLGRSSDPSGPETQAVYALRGAASVEANDLGDIMRQVLPLALGFLLFCAGANAAEFRHQRRSSGDGQESPGNVQEGWPRAHLQSRFRQIDQGLS